jgi:hypothetical protein
MATKATGTMTLLTALGAGLLSACASGEGAESIAGTQWNGTDSDGYRYEFHFDRGGGLVAYDPDSDLWTMSDDEFVLSWSQDGGRVTVKNSSVTEDLEFVADGTIEGDELVLVEAGDPGNPLGLTQVTSANPDVAGTEWVGMQIVSDDSVEAPEVTFHFDPNGWFRQHFVLSDREYWMLPREDYALTWTILDEAVVMTISDIEFDFEYSLIGTIDGDQMTVETDDDPANTIAILTRVE